MSGIFEYVNNFADYAGYRRSHYSKTMPRNNMPVLVLTSRVSSQGREVISLERVKVSSKAGKQMCYQYSFFPFAFKVLLIIFHCESL